MAIDDYYQMEFKDYYGILGVEADAPTDGIKGAYRRLARKFHPDVSSEEDAEARFKEIGEAWEVLRDPEKRMHFDMIRAGGGRRPEFDTDGAQFSGGGFTGADAAGFSDFFRDLFGADGGPGRAHGHGFAGRGEDLRSQLAVTLEESFAGSTQTVTIRVPAIVDGYVQYEQRNLKVTVPAGIIDGQEIRLKGQGAPGNGGASNGDLYIAIRIAPHPRFEADRKDIHLHVPITPWEAALGASVQVPTLGGLVNVKVPQGQNKLRLRGRGLPGDTPGDQYLHFNVVVPEPTSEEREHYEALAASSQSQERPGVREELEA